MFLVILTIFKGRQGGESAKKAFRASTGEILGALKRKGEIRNFFRTVRVEKTRDDLDESERRTRDSRRIERKTETGRRQKLKRDGGFVDKPISGGNARTRPALLESTINENIECSWRRVERA